MPGGGEARARGVPKDGCKRLPPIVPRMLTAGKDTGSVQRSVGCGWRGGGVTGGVRSGGGGTRFESHRYGRLVQTGDRMSRRSDHLFTTSPHHVFTFFRMCSLRAQMCSLSSQMCSVRVRMCSLRPRSADSNRARGRGESAGVWPWCRRSSGAERPAGRAGVQALGLGGIGDRFEV